MKNRRSGWKGLLITVLLFAMLVAGVFLLLYPTVADLWNKSIQSKAIARYREDLEAIDNSEVEAALESGYAYNRRMAQTGIFNPEDVESASAYNSELSVSGPMMGSIEIPSINVNLPIYHGTSDGVLSSAIGHLSASSLPIGAESFDDKLGIVADPEDGSHCILSGHRGLPSARLFTDLDRLSEGDTFAIDVYGNKFVYEVDQIRVVEPTDFADLKLIKGEDYCTLITCTPYGVNTHRMLVRGHRIGSESMAAYSYHIQSNAVMISNVLVAACIGLPMLIIIFLIVFVFGGKKESAYRRTRIR